MQVNITPNDLREGVPGDPYCCALALALQRHTLRKWVVAVDTIFPSDSPDAEIEVSDAVQDFQDAFDSGLAEPCVLDVPVEQVLEKERKRGRP